MSLIIDSRPGRVAAIRAQNPRPFVLNVGHEFVYGIATSVALQRSVAAQIATSLANTVFITPFGDNASSLTVNFILNGKDCDSPYDGAADFLDAYDATKLLQTQNTAPRTFVVGGRSFYGYIIGANLSASVDGGQHMILGTLNAVVWD